LPEQWKESIIVGRWGWYLGPKEMRQEGSGEDDIIWSFRLCTCH
jgi:hypothetical protein